MLSPYEKQSKTAKKPNLPLTPHDPAKQARITPYKDKKKLK